MPYVYPVECMCISYSTVAPCSLPMFPGMTDADVEKVINVMQEVILQNRDE